MLEKPGDLPIAIGGHHSDTFKFSWICNTIAVFVSISGEIDITELSEKLQISEDIIRLVYERTPYIDIIENKVKLGSELRAH